MKLMLEAEENLGDAVRIRLLALNDSYEPVVLDRRLLVGPNPSTGTTPGLPLPVSVEADAADEDQNLVLLNPWCLYGRERSFDHLGPGPVTFHGYLLSRHTTALRPEGPADTDALLLSAEPRKVDLTN